MDGCTSIPTSLLWVRRISTTTLISGRGLFEATEPGLDVDRQLEPSFTTILIIDMNKGLVLAVQGQSVRIVWPAAAASYSKSSLYAFSYKSLCRGTYPIFRRMHSHNHFFLLIEGAGVGRAHSEPCI